jgi:UDP-N-acetylmuramate dehydrogenase
MLSRLRYIPGLLLTEHAPLANYTRFGIGGPARILADATTDDALIAVVRTLRDSGGVFTVIGGGSNLVASDEGFPGVVVRYTGASIHVHGTHVNGTAVHAAAGAVLQDLVDFTIEKGLRGVDTMTGIPGWVGGAIYGNAGAYGHSIHERVERVRFFDGDARREIGHRECEFAYRESVFKRHKDWIILSATLFLDHADATELRKAAAEIRKIRDAKYPPSMRCAGSIFKNLILDQLPEAVRALVPQNVVREGKVPSAYFLEQAGAKGMVRGGVHVADYHANLIYNEGGGTAAQVRELITELKERVRQQFGFELEEEVQYI